MDNASPSTEQPGPGTPPPSGPRVTRDEIKDLGRLRRSVTDRHVAGVAGGIARHLDIDAIIVRVALVVAVFFGGAGLLLYVAGWILVPEEGTDDEPLGLDQRNRTIALAGVGVLALIAALGDWAGAFWFPWPLAIIAALTVWFLHRKQQDGAGTPTGGPAYGAAPHDPTAYGAAPHDPATYDPAAYGPTTYDPSAYDHPTYGPPGRRVPATRASAVPSSSSSPWRSSPSPRESSGWSTWPAHRSPTAPTPPSRSASPH